MLLNINRLGQPIPSYSINPGRKVMAIAEAAPPLWGCTCFIWIPVRLWSPDGIQKAAQLLEGAPHPQPLLEGGLPSRGWVPSVSIWAYWFSFPGWLFSYLVSRWLLGEGHSILHGENLACNKWKKKKAGIRGYCSVAQRVVSDSLRPHGLQHVSRRGATKQPRGFGWRSFLLRTIANMGTDVTNLPNIRFFRTDIWVPAVC